MIFRTELPPLETLPDFDHSDKVMALGSCFANNIGERLHHLKWQIQVNPLGIVYNPMSLFRHLRFLLEAESPDPDHYVKKQDIWHHLDFHGDLSAPSQEACKKNIDKALEQARQHLCTSKKMILTLGTAWAFQHLPGNHLVANNHKLPSKEFEKILLDPGDIVEAGYSVLTKVKEEYPDLEVLISVSPVRHLANGLIDNNRSKAVLILAVQQLTERLEHVHYFPGYELLMDDLRDYRFYAEDLSHPNSLAMDYIWEYFSEVCLNEQTRDLTTRIEKLHKRLDHRPFYPDTASHREFVRKTREMIQELTRDFPYIQWKQGTEDGG